MKTYKATFPETWDEVREAWSKGESSTEADCFQTPIEAQQEIADAVADNRQTHEQLLELINTLSAMDTADAPPAIGAAANLLGRMYATAQDGELNQAKRKNLVWSEIHPGRNKLVTQMRDKCLRGVVDYLLHTDPCEQRINGWTLENLADPDSPLCGIVSDSAIQKVRTKVTAKQAWKVEDEPSLATALEMLQSFQAKLDNTPD